MNKFITYLFIIILAAMLAGCCASTLNVITSKKHSERNNIFTEVAKEDLIPEGFGAVMITTSIKTHLEGYYIGESEASVHGKNVYPFVFNIDGQAVVWNALGKKHEVQKNDADGKTNSDPEAGAGIKYVLNKKIRLQTGSHKLFFGLPADNYYQEVSFTVKEGETLYLSFNPIYKYKTHPLRIPTFMRGISRYDVFIDGTLIIK